MKNTTIMKTVSTGADRLAERKSRGSASRVTLVDVAKRAGVAPMTASRALRNPDEVSVELRDRVYASADALGYVRNKVAGGLAGAKTDVVGAIVPSIHNAFFSETLEALAAELETREVSLLVGNTGYERGKELQLAKAFLSWRPRALVLTGVSHPPQLRQLAAAAGVPVIEMWDLARSPIMLSVGFSHREVGAALARHFFANGYRRLAFAGAAMKDDPRARKRCEGFVAEASALGLPAATVVNVEARATSAAGRVALGQLLQMEPRVEGAAFSNDTLALGAIFECQSRGLVVPRDLAVAGFGNQEFAAASYPTLTTVAPPSREIGRLVAKAVFDNDLRAVGRLDVGFDLIVRESTSPR